MIYEIILTKKHTKDDFTKLINRLSRHERILSTFKIIVLLKDYKVLYYLETRHKIPVTISSLDGFIFKSSDNIEIPRSHGAKPIYVNYEEDILELKSELEIKRKETLVQAVISFTKLKKDKIITRTHLFTENGKSYSPLFINPSILLSIDFENNKSYTKSGAPKYLNITKNLSLLKPICDDAILKVETFPYSNESLYLPLQSYDFVNHSIVLGSSGTGKSKFISLLVANALKLPDRNYKFVIIDPHAALENDIGDLGKVVDFKASMVDLFKGSNDDVIAETENLLELFKSEMSALYNSKVERVLRHSIFLLLTFKCFNFANLRKLISSLEFRNEMIKKSPNVIPYSVINFFLGDFNELKTKHYSEAISPIIGFLDEMELLPAFNNHIDSENLLEVIKENDMTLFSLDNKILGSAGVKMISGLIMQALFSFSQNRMLDTRIVFIIDEVSIIETPILRRFLSEARKYNVGLIMMGQYFNQISNDLRNSIFANIQNYYIFKVSKKDASLIVDNLNIKLENTDDKEKTINFLSELNNREVVVRVTKDGKYYPPVKGVTLDFIGHSKPLIEQQYNKEKPFAEKRNIDFVLDDIDLHNIMKKNSTRRKEFE